MFAALQRERLTQRLLQYSDEVVEVETRLGRARLELERLSIEHNKPQRAVDSILAYDVDKYAYFVNQYKTTRLLKIEKYPYYMMEYYPEHFTAFERDYCTKVIQCYEAFMMQIRNLYPEIPQMIQTTRLLKAEPEASAGCIFTTENMQRVDLKEYTTDIYSGEVYASNHKVVTRLSDVTLQ